MGYVLNTLCNITNENKGEKYGNLRCIGSAWTV